MKNLGKILTLLSLPLLFSFNSKAQNVDLNTLNSDSVKVSSEIIKNYYENKKILMKKPETVLGTVYGVFYCDLNNDSLSDLRELYGMEFDELGNLTLEKDSIGNIKPAWWYIVGRGGNSKLFFDLKRDRLNGNEIFIEGLDKVEGSEEYIQEKKKSYFL